MDALEYVAATSYEDAELRRDRVGMLDMEDEYIYEKRKPLSIHQEFKRDLRRRAEEQAEEMEDDFDGEFEDEEDDYFTERTMDYEEW
jgi:Mg2+/Co2+ transporter CorC